MKLLIDFRLPLSRRKGRGGWGVRGGLSLLALLAVTGLVACGDDNASPSGSPSAASSSSATPVEGDITVFAASSLTDIFNEAGKEFQAANPKAHVTFNFAASSALATQINEGGPADVFASADTAQMKVVTDKGEAETPQVFANNLPVVVVPKGDNVVQSFPDLAKPGVKLVLAGQDVPIGKYARQVFQRASGASGISADFSDKVLANLKSEEANVRAVLAKVQVGEADAGVVYTTDVAAAGGQVKTIAIPSQYNIIAEYPIATIKDSKHADVAQAFVDFILSDKGQDLLQKYGFTNPGAG